MGGEHSHVLTVGVSIGPLVLRVALLAAVPAVAGFALLRAFLTEPGRVTKTAVAGIAAGAVLLELMLAGGLDLPSQTVPLILAALAVPLYLIRTENPKRDTVMRLIAPWILGLACVLALIKFAQAWLGGGSTPTVAVLLHTGAVLALTGLAWFVVCRPRTKLGTGIVRGTAALLGIVVAAGAAQATVLRAPYPPTPGAATIHQAVVGPATFDVLVVPNRPGWNLVHVPSGDAEVGTDRANLTPAEPRPGTTGVWAAVRLPTGRSGLWIRQKGSLGVVYTDAGNGRPAPETVTGPDGPECASALIGQMLANPQAAPAACPADELTDEDAATLRSTMDYLGTLGIQGVTLVTDGSPRSTAAERVVREAGLGTANGPLLVVSGWTTADTALRQATKDGRIPVGGTYLAPWLVSTTLLEIRAGSHVPLREAPSDELPRRYRDALSAGFPGQHPTTAGYRTWLAEQRLTEPGPVRIYQVTPAKQRAAQDGWLPNGSITAMSGPLGTP